MDRLFQILVSNLSKYLDVTHVIPCANGTDAYADCIYGFRS